MQLTLVRHGEAAPPVNGNDIKRPLTARGHAQAEQTATFLKDIVKPDIFVVSPLLRAQETLAHIQTYFKDVPVLLCDKIKPDDDAKEAIEWLSQIPYESIVVVCHMNVVGHIAELLTQIIKKHIEFEINHESARFLLICIKRCRCTKVFTRSSDCRY